MGGWRSVTHGVAALLLRRRHARDLTDEVEHFYEQALRERLAEGLSLSEARRAVRLEMGSMTAAQETARGGGWEHRIETLLKDLRYATRRLARNPAFTAVAVLSLALGIGANTAIFSLVNATLIRQLPVERPEELAYVTGGTGAMSVPDYVELRDNATVFTTLAAWGGITGVLSIGDESRLVVGNIVTGNLFPMLGLRPQRGRLIGPSDDVMPGGHPVAVISDRLWESAFGRRDDIIGASVRYNGQPFTVIGVMPPAFTGPYVGDARDIYVPMMMQALARPPRGGYSGEMDPDLLHRRTNRWLSVMGRLANGRTPEQALAQLTAITREQERLAPSEGARVPPGTVTMVNDGDAEDRARLVSVSTLLLAVVGTVLLIACVNVANLTLAQSSARHKEIAVRLALGASRGRLVRQLLAESVLLSTIGGAVGLTLAWSAARAMRAAPPPNGALPIVLDFSLDGRVLAFTFVLAVATGIAFGLVPALRASRPALVPALKDQGTGTHGHAGRMSGRNGLVVLQLMLSFVLLAAAGLFLRSFRMTQSVTLGFDADRVVVSPLSINILRYTRTDGRAFYRQIVERVQSIPGVEAVSLARWVPLSGSQSIRGLTLQGQEAPASEFRNEGAGIGRPAENSVNVNTIGPAWFRTMGISLLRGRDFTARDDSGGVPVAIVNEAFAARHLRGANPLGQRFSVNGANGPWLEVVGVARDFKVLSLTETAEPLVFVPVLQNHETGMSLFVRAGSAASAARLVPAIGAEVQALERNLPVANVAPLSDLVRTSLYTARSGARLLIGFGAMALLLAAIGLYGVISYAVTRRTREFGVRMALGAHPATLLRGVLGEASRLTLAGIVAGALVALAVSRLLRSFLYGTSTNDVMVFAVIPVVLFAVALGAAARPAVRAMRIDPIKALREE